MTKRTERAFEEGLDTGVAVGKHHAYEEVLQACADGLLDEWLEYQRPKEWEEWKVYDLAHPEARERWGSNRWVEE